MAQRHHLKQLAFEQRQLAQWTQNHLPQERRSPIVPLHGHRTPQCGWPHWFGPERAPYALKAKAKHASVRTRSSAAPSDASAGHSELALAPTIACGNRGCGHECFGLFRSCAVGTNLIVVWMSTVWSCERRTPLDEESCRDEPRRAFLYRHVYLLVNLRQSKSYKSKFGRTAKAPIFVDFRERYAIAGTSEDKGRNPS